MLRDQAKKVLDYGAGRGSFMDEVSNPSKSKYRNSLQDLRGPDVHVTAADIDSAVKTHRASQAQVVFVPGQPLPFEESQFDLIVSDWTFEHIETPNQVAGELLRVVKPGGWICARTTNGFSYLRLAANLIPNRLHAAVLKRVQPERKEIDVFPTYYRMNSKSSLKKAFPGHELHVTYVWGEPSYYFGSSLLFRAFKLVHKFMPNFTAPMLFVFVRKAAQ
ncbi:MAG: methyltransferase domain-containing protein [Pirellulaceae bacterium]|nr:methyltransferase domain-containing protein [Pirellulaceae bacterium]